MFDTGLLTICTKRTTTTAGAMPAETLETVRHAYYGERTVSHSRLYEARGADCRVDKLVRVPFDTDVLPDQYAMFEDGSQYRVDAVLDVIVKRSTRAKELTLVRLEELLDVESAIET